MTGFRILGGGSLASSLDLRYTRKSALDLPPGKLRSDPPSFGCSADDAPVQGTHREGVAWLVRWATGDPGRCGGVDEAACGARKKTRRAEPAASGRKGARVAE